MRASADAPAELERVQDALLPPLLRSPPPPPASAREQRFDLSVEDVPAQRVFASIAAGTRYSLTVHPGVIGSVSVNLKDVTVGEALQALHALYGYEFEIDGSHVYILPASLRTRTFEVSYLAGPSAAGRDFWRDLGVTLHVLAGCRNVGARPPECPAGRSVAVNPQAGVAVVRAMPSELRAVDSYLETIRLAVERQVLLEARIVEVTLDPRYRAGIDWQALGGRASGTGGKDGAGRMFSLSPGTGDFGTLERLLEAQGSVRVLSSLRMAALNNRNAVLKVAGDEPGGAIPAGARFPGVTLDITPRIDQDANVILHLRPSVASASGRERTVSLESDSVVRVGNGGIVALGGLMKAVTGPRSEPNGAARELIVLIRPTVVRSAPPGAAR